MAETRPLSVPSFNFTVNAVRTQSSAPAFLPTLAYKGGQDAISVLVTIVTGQVYRREDILGGVVASSYEGKGCLEL